MKSAKNIKKRPQSPLARLRHGNFSGKIDKGSLFVVVFLVAVIFGGFVFTGGVMPARHPEDDPNVINVRITNPPQPTSAPQLPFDPTACNQTNNCIIGIVYIDTNRDGIADTNEGGFPGANITIANTPNRTTTDSNGVFGFTTITGTTAEVRLEVPPGYQVTTPNPVTVTLPLADPVEFGVVL